MFTVALTQTLAKRETSLDYGLVIADECHNAPAVEAHEVDGAVLPVTVSTLACAFKGWCEPKSWQPFIGQLEGDNDRNEILVAAAIKSSLVTGTVMLTATVFHAKMLHDLIKQRGVAALLLHGQLPKKERERRMNEASGAQLIIGTLSLLSEGIDWPHVGGVIFAAPVSAAVDKLTPSATRLIQSIGRARRPYPGKTKAFVLDVVDKHPFGLAAHKKRAEIYQRYGFSVINKKQR